MTSELWIKLQQPNAYLYVFAESQLVYINCPYAYNNTNNFFVDTGMITIAPQCKIKTDNLEITAFNVIESIHIREFTPAIKVNLNFASEKENITKIDLFKIPVIELPNLINYR